MWLVLLWYVKMLSVNFEEVKTSALNLSLKERATLAKELLDSVDSPSEEELEGLWLDEVGKRIERVQRGKSKLVPLEEALKRTKAVIAQHATK
jgi:putative addiction module component (TIGR02574 family)